MSLEDWEVYVGVKRVKAWGPEEAEFVERLPPDEQDLIYELAIRLDIRPVEDRQEGPEGPVVLS